MKNPSIQEQAEASEFALAIKGSFTSALRWHHLDALWERILEHPDGWYIYALSEAPPETPASPADLHKFITHMDELLHRDHDEDYCGIVYADNPAAPGMVKIYDPHNLGVSCGYSTNPPLPGWILSRVPPTKLEPIQPSANNRKRWWQKLFG